MKQLKSVHLTWIIQKNTILRATSVLQEFQENIPHLAEKEEHVVILPDVESLLTDKEIF